MPDPAVVPLGRAGMLARVYWMGCGDPLLLLLLLVIIAKHPKLPSLLDAAFFVAVASLILVRYVDIRFLNGQTGEGKPATLADWRRYALLIATVTLGAWLVARVIVHFLR